LRHLIKRMLNLNTGSRPTSLRFLMRKFKKPSARVAIKSLEKQNKELGRKIEVLDKKLVAQGKDSTEVAASVELAVKGFAEVQKGIMLGLERQEGALKSFWEKTDVAKAGPAEGDEAIARVIEKIAIAQALGGGV